MPFNVLEHDLVPEHYILSEEEGQDILTRLKIRREQLPKIKKTDPCIQALETVHGDIDVGRIVKVVRRSHTANIAVSYRLVVDR